VGFLDAHEGSGEEICWCDIFAQVQVSKGVVELERQQVSFEWEKVDGQFGYCHISKDPGLFKKAI
jgi:hypothetical protein